MGWTGYRFSNESSDFRIVGKKHLLPGVLLFIILI
jgi:hypothetical protein